MHDSLDAFDRLLWVLVFKEHQDIARFAVLGDQHPAPKRARQRVLKTFRSFSQALDRAYLVDRVDLLREFLDSTQVARRRNIARRHRQENFRLRRDTSHELVALPDSGIARGKEKIAIHHRLKIDKD